MSNLFVLPFDHRASFAKHLLGFPYPKLTAAQRKRVTAMKQVVFEAFLKARKKVAAPNDLAILVDEEFGANIISKAVRAGILCAVSVEKSGQEVFDFEYGGQFRAHLQKIKPAFAKALVRYNVAHSTDNKLQRKRLKMFSFFCKTHGVGFMLEILLTGKGSQLTQAQQAMREMIKDSIQPTVWKLEGFDKPSDWQRLRTLTRADLIVLGRGESKAHVEDWIKAAAQSRVVRGFAIGRTVFFKPLEAYRDKKIDRSTAVRQIAKNYLHFINLWQKYSRS